MLTEINTYFVIGFICAVLLAYTSTPLVRVLAFKLGAIDVPADNRRMHKKPIPRIGGLAIFISFALTVLFFCNVDSGILYMLGGALILVAVGVIDDIYRINAWIKFAIQIIAAFVPVLGGIEINQISIGGKYISLGIWAIPVTVLWIVGLTNAINLIDGLDGLSCGVSTISAISIFFVLILQGGDTSSALITLILIGSCVGFLPYNRNPAKIFMGDTGALFLGYTLSVISVGGMFKFHTAISMIVPLIIFALPLADTTFAILRRILSGRSPFSADRGHLHHRLVDMGFTQKESVKILYSICGILGLVAVFTCDRIFPDHGVIKAVAIAVIALILFVLHIIVLSNPGDRVHTGLIEDVKNEEIPKEAIERAVKEAEAEARAEETNK